MTTVCSKQCVLTHTTSRMILWCCPHCNDIHINKSLNIKDKDKKRNETKAQDWVIDSGATIHNAGDASSLESICSTHKQEGIKVADNGETISHVVGTDVIPLTDKKGNAQDVVLHDVICYPSINTILLSQCSQSTER